MRNRNTFSMPRDSRAPGAKRLAGVLLLGLLVCGSALAVGALDTGVLLASAVVALVSFLLVWSGADAVIPRRPATILFWTGIGLAGFTLLQLVPLPAALVRVASPHAADIWDRCLRPLGEGPRSWMTLSLDPTATRIELLRGTTYLLSFVTALRVAGRAGGSVALQRIVILGAVLVVLSAAVHFGFDVKRLYGFYRPRTGVWAVLPLFNGNHLAGYLNIGLAVAFGSLISPRPVAPRALLAVAVVSLVAAEMWIASRGAVGAMIGGMVVAVAFTIRLRRGRDTLRWVSSVVVGVAASALVIVMVVPGTIPMLVDSDLSKLQEPLIVLRKMVPNYVLVGVGRGAFESTYPEFRPGTGFFVWTHPENFVAQWVSEWGVPVAASGFAALAFALRPKVLFVAAQPAIGAWAALFVTTLHNLVDFNSEVPAVVLACTLCAAMVTSGTSTTEKSADRWAAPKRVIPLLSGAAALAMILVVTRGGELLDDRETLQALSQPGAADREVYRERMRRALLDHPAEPYFPYLGAVRASWAHDESPVPWIDRALERAPVYPPAHLVLARSLRRFSRSQARLEYRIYEEQAGDAIVMDLAEVEPLIGSFEDAMDLTPAGPKGVKLLELFAGRIAQRLPATRARIDAEIVRRDPNAMGALMRLANDAILDAKDAPWCATTADTCIAEALRAADRAERAAPDRCAGYAAHARALVLSGQADKAFALLHGAQSALDEGERVPCLEVAVDLATELNRDTEATRAVDAIAKTSCGPFAACVDHLLTAASLEEQRGHGTRALGFLRRAHSVAPEDDRVTERLAAAASASGLHVEAAQLYEDLAHKHPEDARFGSLATGERARVTSVP